MAMAFDGLDNNMIFTVVFQETKGCVGPTWSAGWGSWEKEEGGWEGNQGAGEHQGEVGGDCSGSSWWEGHYDATDERWGVPNGKVSI